MLLVITKDFYSSPTTGLKCLEIYEVDAGQFFFNTRIGMADLFEENKLELQLLKDADISLMVE